MTWCDKCERDFDIGLLSVDGDCPSCGTWLADPPGGGSIPWHFWVVVVAAVAYLGWRAMQGVLWLVSQLF